MASHISYGRSGLSRHGSKTRPHFNPQRLLLVAVRRDFGGPRRCGAEHAPAIGVESNSAKDVPREASKADAKKAKASYEEGLRAEQRLNWDAALAAYSDAANWDPNVKEYLLHLAIAKSRIVQKKVDAAERDAVSGRLDAARRELLDASSIDPSNKTVQERIVELTAAEPERVREIDEPEIMGEPQPRIPARQAEFRLSRGDTPGGVSAVGLAIWCGRLRRSSGDLHARTVRFQVTDVDFPTAARLLGDMTATFWRPLTSRLFFVTDNTPQKRKEYDASVVRTILLPSSETPEQMTEMLRMVRDITGITRSDLDTGEPHHHFARVSASDRGGLGLDQQSPSSPREKWFWKWKFSRWTAITRVSSELPRLKRQRFTRSARSKFRKRRNLPRVSLT